MERIEVPDETEAEVNEVAAENDEAPTDVVAGSVLRAIEEGSLDRPKAPEDDDDSEATSEQA